MRSFWWKALGTILVLYSVIAGLLGPVPVLPIVHESIRTLYYHLPMWFSMFLMYGISVVYSIKYLSSGKEEYDLMAVESINVGIVFCFFGLISGSFWASVTWGDPWPSDPKLNGSAIATLMYLAYLVLRSSLNEEQKRAKISAIYNIFAFPIMIVLMYILPKLTDSLHPASGGNGGFGQFDLDNSMRLVLYPGIIGWMLLALWMLSIRYRYRIILFQKNQ
ncbi:heme exporter protein C [bacterium A37T11]|nr:heme exporter protein C [bacterium A37T11]